MNIQSLISEIAATKAEGKILPQNIILTFGVSDVKFPDVMLKKVYGDMPIIRCKSERYANSKASRGESVAGRIYGFDPTDTTRNILAQWNISRILEQFILDQGLKLEDALAIQLLDIFPGYGESNSRWVYGSFPRNRFDEKAIENYKLFDEVNILLNGYRNNSQYGEYFVKENGKPANKERFYNKTVNYNNEGFNDKVLRTLPRNDGKAGTLRDQVGSAYNIPSIESTDGLLLVVENKLNAKNGREYLTVSTFDTVGNKPFMHYKGDSSAKSKGALADQSVDTSNDYTPPTKLEVEKVDLGVFIATYQKAGLDINNLAHAQANGFEFKGKLYKLT